MAAFKKMFSALRANKADSDVLHMRTISNKSLPSTYSGNAGPSVYSFRHNYDVSRRASDMSTLSNASHINYASELSNWRQVDTNLGVSSLGSSMMPNGYYGQMGYVDPYTTSMQYQNSNFGYSLMPEHQMMIPDNPMFPDNRMIGAESPLSSIAPMSNVSQSTSRFPSVRYETLRSGLVPIPLDKLKRMRAAKDLYNVLNYMESDDTFLKKANKSSKSKRSSKRLF